MSAAVGFIVGTYTATAFAGALLVGAYIRGKAPDRRPDRVPIATLAGSVLRFDPKRLRRRPMPTSDTNQYALPLAERNPELVGRLRDAAKRLDRKRPGITSAEVIAHLEASDPTMHGHLKMIDRRVMGAVFTTEWMHTGEWRPTGSHGRPQRVWTLREAA